MDWDRRRRYEVLEFSPLQLPGLQLWLRADTGLYQDSAFTTPATADADPVGGWRDQSGNGRDAIQATAGKRPTLKLAIQNGLAVLRFDGVDDFIKATLTVNQPKTVFLVGQSSRITTNQYFADGNTQNTAVLGIPNGSNGTTFRLFAGTILDATASASGFNVIAGIFNGASSALAINGTKTSGAGGATNATALTLGADGAGTTPLQGDIGEALLYDTAFSDALLALVVGYLRQHWGTP